MIFVRFSKRFKVLFLLFIVLLLTLVLFIKNYMYNIGREYFNGDVTYYYCDEYLKKCLLHPNGPYLNKNSCERNCGTNFQDKFYSCKNGECDVDPFGEYTTLDNCKVSCFPPKTNYSYLENDCVPSLRGQYMSKEDCIEKNECIRCKKKYKCNYNTNKCEEDLYGNFDDIVSCALSCHKDDVILYNCNKEKGICEENKERGFKKKKDCLLSCS